MNLIKLKMGAYKEFHAMTFDESRIGYHSFFALKD